MENYDKLIVMQSEKGCQAHLERIRSMRTNSRPLMTPYGSLGTRKSGSSAKIDIKNRQDVVKALQEELAEIGNDPATEAQRGRFHMIIEVATNKTVERDQEAGIKYDVGEGSVIRNAALVVLAGANGGNGTVKERIIKSLKAALEVLEGSEMRDPDEELLVVEDNITALWESKEWMKKRKDVTEYEIPREYFTIKKAVEEAMVTVLHP